MRFLPFNPLLPLSPKTSKNAVVNNPASARLCPQRTLTQNAHAENCCAVPLKAQQRGRLPYDSDLRQMIAQGTWLTAGAAVIDARGRIIEANEEFAAWAGVSPGEGALLTRVLGQKCPSWQILLQEILDDDRTFIESHLEDTSQNPTHWYQLGIVRNKDQFILRINRCLPPPSELAETSWTSLADEKESARDLYARLVRAEAQLQMLSGRWPGVLFSQRADFTFSFVSEKIEDWTGISPAEWNRRPQKFWDLVHEADAGDLQMQLARWRGRGSLTTTYRIRHSQTGKVTYILERRDAITTSNGLVLGYDGAWVDVTRQTIAEKRLASAVWKETLGVLTMGLAHDFSNILSGIYSLSETYHSMAEQGHPFQEAFALIQRTALQASQLVQRIQNLHTGKVGERNYHNPNDLVSDTLEVVKKTVKRRVQMRTKFSNEQLALYIDPVEFQQVLVNLVLNAADAMPDGGDLSFETSLRQEIDPAMFVQGTPPRLPAVCISVRDTGMGIPPEHLPHIFDPFFTTKPLNKGSGLGLYNARLFAEKHDGAIAVDSEEGAGTTFRIWLPLADFSEAERLKQEAGNRRKMLLLLEPSGKMLDPIASSLRMSGFYVATAVTEPGAIELLHSPDGPFDAVLAVLNGRTRISPRIFNEIDRLSLPVKKVVQVAGCNEDEHDSAFLEAADLVMGSDVPASEIAARLRAVLNRPLT